MTPTEVKYVEKLKELIEFISRERAMLYDLSGARRNKRNIADEGIIRTEISALEQEMEKERKIIKADDFSQENADDLEWHEIHDEMNESRRIGEIE